MVSQGRRDFQGLPGSDSGAKNTISLPQSKDNNQSHLFEASNKEDSLQNIPTNDQVLAADKASTNDETSDNRSGLANTQQVSDGRGSPDHVETREVEAIGRSRNVSTQHLQTSGKARNMTSESQMLLSGVQTIPEQLPLILTEGDAEEHESLAIIAGNEQLQGVSTQAVLGNTNSCGSTGMMVFSSTAIAPSGHIIPIGGTNLLVLQGLDVQGQVYQPSTVIVQAAQTQGLKEGAEQASEEKCVMKEYKCPEPGCTKVAPTSSKLKLHMLSHTGERPHKCVIPECDWAFTTAYKLKRHLRGHTGEKPFTCDINGCGKTFTTTYNLKTHQKAHIREQSNVCSHPDCGLSFTTLHRLRVHEKKHVVSHEVHTCTVDGCGKEFKSQGYYNTHVKTHTGERPHACTFEGCGKRFTKASKLTLHVRTHTGERPFVCDEEGCKWAFTSAYKLKRHMRKHSGERPYTCQFSGCGKSFTRASHMRTHQMSHTGQKPYICTYQNCRKGFTAASTLTIHLRKHSGDKPFRCSVEGCDKAYTTAANLRLHQKRHEEKISSQDESMEQEHASDQATSIHYVEIGGVNSVVTSSPNSAPNTPYAVMHTFSGEDFASEDVASLTVVHYSTEETFPPQTPVSDSSHGICFPFNTSDTYATTSHSNVVFTTGTPLPSPGVHYVQASMDVDASESSNPEQVRSQGYVIHKQNSGTEGYIVRERHIVREQNPDTEGYIVREQNSDNEGYIVREQNAGSEGYIVREQTSPSDGYIVHEESSPPGGYIEQSSQTQEYISQAQSSERGKRSEDLTLPTMVVFTSPENEPPTADVTADTDGTDGHGNDGSSESNLGALTLRQRSESTSIGHFAPPSIIFQGEEVKHSEVEPKLSHECSADIHSNIKDPVERNNSTMPGLSLNLSLSDDIDKSPVSPFITDVHDHPLDHESTINLQDLR
ncbi:zinc finger ZXDC-like isoform X2 [Paramuricea clavata]|nr:zinc finger ZXDC-like isoform X2 [Paramuricea clavata]